MLNTLVFDWIQVMSDTLILVVVGPSLLDGPPSSFPENWLDCASDVEGCCELSEADGEGARFSLYSIISAPRASVLLPPVNACQSGSPPRGAVLPLARSPSRLVRLPLSFRS